MHSIMGKQIGTSHMQPMQEALHSYPGLIIALHISFSQRLFNHLFRLDEPLCSFCDEGFERPGREATATHVGEQFSGSCIGQQLALEQIEGDPFEHRSILY